MLTDFFHYILVSEFSFCPTLYVITTIFQVISDHTHLLLVHLEYTHFLLVHLEYTCSLPKLPNYPIYLIYQIIIHPLTDISLL